MKDYPFPDSDPEDEKSEQEAIKEMQARERLRQLQADAESLARTGDLLRPRCTGRLYIGPDESNPDSISQQSQLEITVTGSMVAVGEIIRAAGRIFAEEMYMHEIGVPDSVNRED